MKITFLILSILITICSEGQIDSSLKVDSLFEFEPPNGLYSKITKQIDIIQKRDFDTVLSYISIRGYPDFNEYELKGVGKVSIYGEAILIGLRKNIVSCIRIIDTYDNVYNSKPINLRDDSIIQNLRNQVASFEAEQFLPYVCEIYSDSVSTAKGFSPLERGLHQPFYSLYFKFGDKSRLKEFSFECLNEKYLNLENFPPNLSFKYNRSLKLYQLFFFWMNQY